LPAAFDFWGPNAAACVRFEPEGLRLTLPRGHEGVGPTTGVAAALIVRGDFEITAAFEILHEPALVQARDKLTRFTVDIVLNKPGLNAASISRAVSGKGFQFVTWSGLQDEPTRKAKISMDYLAGAAKTGRLRLTRRAAVLFFYGSKGSDDFTLLKQYPFAADDLSEVRLVGSTGEADAALDVRVLDLRIRAESLPGMPAAGPAVVEGKEWLVIVLGGSLVLALGLGMWLFLRHRRSRSVSAGSARGVPESEADSAPISWICPACGKSLKARAAMAGKKIKCPQCKEVVVVPE